MIDFNNASYVKLTRVDFSKVEQTFAPLLISSECIVGAYKGLRDCVVFTDRRVIALNVQGITGKKKDFTSLPYAKISAYAVETSGVFDLDSELELYLSGVGKVKFEFSGAVDVLAIGQAISEYVL